jgi:hypothetical protein
MSAYRQTCRILQLPIHKAGFLPFLAMVKIALILHCKKGFFTTMIWTSGADYFG